MKGEIRMRKMGDDDPPSLEYIEDPYYPKTETMTPSLDDEEITEFDHRSLYDDDDGMCREWSPETELYLRSLPLDQIFSISDEHEDTSDYQKAEAELGSINPNCDSKRNGLLNSSKQIKILGRLFNRQSIRDVKVTFIDFSKPYLAKISSNDNYKNFLNIGSRGIDVLSFCFHFYLFKSLNYAHDTNRTNVLCIQWSWLNISILVFHFVLI